LKKAKEALQYRCRRKRKKRGPGKKGRLREKEIIPGYRQCRRGAEGGQLVGVGEIQKLGSL